MKPVTLVIDGFDPNGFHLAFDDDGVTFGPSAAVPVGILRGVRVARVRCEVEFADGEDAVLDVPGAPAEPLEPGVARTAGAVRFEVVGAEEEVPAALYWLAVVDGADEGKTFSLPGRGVVTVGKSAKHADISLRDLYVSRVHCELTLDGKNVTVRHLEGEAGTLIDGERIDGRRPLQTGEILRIGNSHLALRTGPNPVPRAESGILSGSASHFGPGSAILSGPASGAVRHPEPPTTILRPTVVPADPLCALEGQILATYRLGPLLGRGPTGASYRGTEISGNRTVSLKVLPAGVALTDDQLEAFANALKPAIRLSHPHVVPLLGAGRSGAHCWIAREYVEGRSAASVAAAVKSGSVPKWTAAVEAAVHLALALECLREHRLLHGSINPHNVLIRKSDDAARLSDVQLRQCLVNCGFEAAYPANQPPGLLGYLAPEQLEDGAFVDELADLYSVGAVLYAMLTGHPPHAGSTPEDVLRNVRADAPEKPSAFSRKIPPQLDRIVLKLLAPDQTDRYEHPNALLRDLHEITSV
jgi:hypothetical protein